MAEKIIYTIGHSTHPIEQFHNLLIAYKVNCVIDVRSTPFSRIAPQYNKPSLSSKLKAANILYAHFGGEFGARHTEVNLLDNDGKVDFEKIRKTELFNQGIQRLHSGLDMEYQIALMCSEANPFDCHRFVMISYQLVREGVSVKHIPDLSTVLSTVSYFPPLLAGVLASCGITDARRRAQEQRHEQSADRTGGCHSDPYHLVAADGGCRAYR